MSRYRFAFVLCASISGSVASASAQQAPVPVGSIEILSGNNSHYGVMIRDGLELALDEINGGAGVLSGRKINLVMEDSAGNKDQAINAARQLIGRDKVVAIIGPTLSTEMFAAGPVANGRHVPIIGTSTTASGITAIGPYVFRTSLPESDVVPVTLRTAQEKFHVNKVAVLYGNDDAFTKSAYDVFKASLEKLGIQVATTETFSNKDTDFSAQLTKIKSLNVDAIVISALVEAAAGIELQARKLGIPSNIFFIGGNGLNSPSLGQIAGAAADGTLVGSPWFIDKHDPTNDRFVAAFRTKYKTEPDQFAAQAYDCMHILAEAIDRAGAEDGDKLQSALLATKHEGVTGPFTFTPGRDPASTTGVVVLQMHDGRFGALP